MLQTPRPRPRSRRSPAHHAAGFRVNGEFTHTSRFAHPRGPAAGGQLDAARHPWLTWPWSGARGQSGAGGTLSPYLLSHAKRLMVVARMTAPNRYAISACCRIVARIGRAVTSVSETWKV